MARLLPVLRAAARRGLAITGALAVMCMAKVYGAFSRRAAYQRGRNATCALLLMSVSVVALAICCVIMVLLRSWLLPMLSAVVPLPLEPANHRFSTDDHVVADCCPLLPFIIMAICSRRSFAVVAARAAWSWRLRS